MRLEREAAEARRALQERIREEEEKALKAAQLTAELERQMETEDKETEDLMKQVFNLWASGKSNQFFT